MPISQLSSHSSSLCQPILSPDLHICPWLPEPSAFCHFSKVALLYFPLLQILTFLLIISSFSLLSSLLPSDLFFHIACHWGARASSSLSYFRSSQTQPFHILSLPLLFFNKSVSSAFFLGLFLLNTVSIGFTCSFTICPGAMTKFSLCLASFISFPLNNPSSSSTGICSTQFVLFLKAYLIQLCVCLCEHLNLMTHSLTHW